MRRKAQVMPLPPANTQMGGDALLQDLLQLLGGGVAPEVLNPHEALPPSPSLGDVAETEMEGAIETAPIMPEYALGEALEATAFNKLQCGLDCLEKSLAMFKEYESMRDDDHEDSDAEIKAIEEIDKLVEKMKEVFEDLAKAEIEEHEDLAAEAEGKKIEIEVELEEDEEDEEDEEEEEEEEVKASLRGFVRTANKKTSNSIRQTMVPFDLEF